MYSNQFNSIQYCLVISKPNVQGKQNCVHANMWIEARLAQYCYSIIYICYTHFTSALLKCGVPEVHFKSEMNLPHWQKKNGNGSEHYVLCWGLLSPVKSPVTNSLWNHKTFEQHTLRVKCNTYHLCRFLAGDCGLPSENRFSQPYIQIQWVLAAHLLVWFICSHAHVGFTALMKQVDLLEHVSQSSEVHKCK